MATRSPENSHSSSSATTPPRTPSHESVPTNEDTAGALSALPPHTQLARRLVSMLEDGYTYPSVASALQPTVDSYGGLPTLKEELLQLASKEDAESISRLLALQHRLVPILKENLWKRHAIPLGHPPDAVPRIKTCCSNRGLGLAIAISFFDETSNALLDIESGKILKGSFDDFAFSPDGKHRFIVNQETNRIVDLQSGEEVTFPGLGPLALLPTFSPDGTKAISYCTSLGKAAWVDVITRKEIYRLDGNTSRIRPPSFSPQGRDIFGRAVVDDQHKIFDLRSSKEIPLPINSRNIQYLGDPLFSSNGNVAIQEIRFDGSIHFVDLLTGNFLGPAKHDISRTDGIAVAPRGDAAFAIATIDHASTLYDIFSGHTVTVDGHALGDPSLPKFSPSGRAAYSLVQVERGRKIVNLRNFSFENIPASNIDHIQDLYFSAFAEDCYAPMHADGAWKLFRVDTGRFVPIPGSPPEMLRGMYFSPNGREAFLRFKQDGVWKLFNLYAQQVVESPILGGRLEMPTFSHDSSQALSLITFKDDTPPQIMDIFKREVVPLPPDATVLVHIEAGPAASLLSFVGVPGNVYVIDLSGNYISDVTKARAQDRRGS